MKSIYLFFIIMILQLDVSSQNPVSKFFSTVAKIWQPVWGEYTEGSNTNRNPPLTTFDRGVDVYWGQREKIRSNIKLTLDPLDYKRIYTVIYRFADTSNVVLLCEPNGICVNARIAKDAAFVYLMGFDENGDDLDPTARAAFYNKAVSVLERYKGFLLWFVDFSFDSQQARSKELIMMLQAHDYLMTARGAGITSYIEMKDVKESLANYTYELYSRSNNFRGSLDRYNNLSLLVAGAVGMAACVLSDQTVYFLEFQRKPSRWANAAHSYIQRTLWDGPGILGSTFFGSHGPMSMDAGNYNVSGYAEGPHYFQYGFENLLPFFITYQNFVNGDRTGTYYTSMLNFSGNQVRNYVYNPAFEQNLYKWYSNIRMPNGDCPTYDDSNADLNMSGILALTRKNYNLAPNYQRLKLRGISGMQFRQDYLAAFTYPTKASHTNTTNYQMSGDMIVRKNTVKMENAHYLHLNAKGLGSSLNGHRPLGYGHEHGDLGNFIITAGEDVLAIDPAYYGFDYREDINKGEHHNVITIDGDGPDPEDGINSITESRIINNGNGYKMELDYNYYNYTFGMRSSVKSKLKRSIEVYEEGNIRYYQINDIVTNKNWFESQWVQFNLNGNGRVAEGTYFLYPGKNNVAVWDHPCNKDNNKSDNWKMQASLTTYLQGSTASNNINTVNDNLHGNVFTSDRYNPDIADNAYKTNWAAEIGQPQTISGYDTRVGYHSRMTLAVIHFT